MTDPVTVTRKSFAPADFCTHGTLDDGEVGENLLDRPLCAVGVNLRAKLGRVEGAEESDSLGQALFELGGDYIAAVTHGGSWEVVVAAAPLESVLGFFHLRKTGLN
ncbi:MAG: hypothetical protein R6V84_13710 [Desulfobacterales bacterium]